MEAIGAALILSGLAALARYYCIPLAERFSTLAFWLVSLGLRPEAKAAFKNEALHYLLEQIWHDRVHLRSDPLVAARSVYRTLDLLTKGPFERRYYAAVSSESPTETTWKRSRGLRLATCFPISALVHVPPVVAYLLTDSPSALAIGWPLGFLIGHLVLGRYVKGLSFPRGVVYRMSPDVRTVVAIIVIGVVGIAAAMLTNSVWAPSVAFLSILLAWSAVIAARRGRYRTLSRLQSF